MAGKIEQYLRTEYIQPPSDPSTLDAKNSPLALLAQTCSAIGKEAGNFKKLNFSPNRFSLAEDTTSSSKTFQNTSLRSLTPTSPASSLSQGSSPPLSNEKLSLNGVLKRKKSPSAENAPLKKTRRSPHASERRHPGNRHCEGTTSFQSADHNGIVRNQEATRRHRSFHESSDLIGVKPSYSRKVSSSSSSKRHGLPPMLLPVDQFRESTDSVSPQAQMIPFYTQYHADYREQHAVSNFSFDWLNSPHLQFYGLNNLSNAYPFYAQMLLASAGKNTGFVVNHTPHVCNWASPETGKCGKKFSSSDELFHHLKTHVMTKTNTNLHSRSNSLMMELEKIAQHPYAPFLPQQASGLVASTFSAIPKLRNPSLLPQSRHPFHKYNYDSDILNQPVRFPSLSKSSQSETSDFPDAMYGYNAA